MSSAEAVGNRPKVSGGEPEETHTLQLASVSVEHPDIHVLQPPAWSRRYEVTNGAPRGLPVESIRSSLPGIPDSISLVVPAYNEEDRLRSTLQRMVRMLRDIGVPYEVIVISDGTDGTPQVAAEFQKDGVTCYQYPRKLGRGGAILQGFRKANYSVVAFSDADGSVPPEDAEKILRMALSGNPVVIASRRLTPEIVAVPETRGRRMVGGVWHAIVKSVLGVAVKDAQCGFKVFSKPVVDTVILPRVTITNRTFDVLMLFHVMRAGVPIREVPVRYVHDFRTRMPIGKAVPVMFVSLIGIFVANVLWDGEKPLPRFVLRLQARLSSV